MKITHTDETQLQDCRFCSLVSKANKEDPIGTAGTCDHWLIMEIPQPWPQEIFQENPIIKSLVGLFQELVSQHGIKLKPILIAPDREYSNPGFTRVFYYYRPAKLFSRFEKQEFIVP
ncbi:MAG: sucrase ferredoxin, partial [Richelia sp. RM1_1_1]|nr:sucrase ferredoxin [Richelia sp. SM1_7_0]NJN12843.1 sucrase ferredoxin [Richelia sp. RM1_1_1]